MSFSDLPRELRNIIYHEVLCPPDGIHLQHLDWDRRMRKFKTDVLSGIHRNHDNSEEAENHDLDVGIEMSEVKKCYQGESIDWWEERREERWEMSDLDLSAITPLPTALFYLNHQIRQEASEVFYRFNRFTFESSARAALHFLKGLPPGCRRHIKSIGFMGRSMLPNDRDCIDSWDSLWDFINHQMSVSSVTIQVPGRPWHKINERKRAKESPNTGIYWWPAPRLLVAALMDGKIQQLRIAYLVTLGLRDWIQESGNQAAEPFRNKILAETLKFIHSLRYPRPQEELDREAHEGKALRTAIARGQPHKFDSMDALVADQVTRRQRFNFVVTREDVPVGDLGTVLVLTRPTAS